MLELHYGLANTATLYTLALAIWAFVRFARNLGVDGSYLGALVIGEGLLVVQALAGVAIFGSSGLQRPGLHVLYGIVALISFPAFYAAIRGRDSRSEMLLWGFLAFFVFGLTIRLRITGQ